MSSEVEETLKRLVGHKGVIGTIVVNSDGIVSPPLILDTAYCYHYYCILKLIAIIFNKNQRMI